MDTKKEIDVRFVRNQDTFIYGKTRFKTNTWKEGNVISCKTALAQNIAPNKGNALLLTLAVAQQNWLDVPW